MSEVLMQNGATLSKRVNVNAAAEHNEPVAVCNPLHSVEQRELAQLRAEVLRLKVDNRILQMAAAYLARESGLSAGAVPWFCHELFPVATCLHHLRRTGRRRRRLCNLSVPDFQARIGGFYE